MPLNKRIFDLVAACLGLILLSPVILLIAILVRILIGKPVLFRQSRPGYKAQTFYIYKFRTMTEARDADGKLLPDAVRLVPFGRFLRSLSLDELPELYNILRGDMSVVGPRPLLMEYLPHYSPEQMRRHDELSGSHGLGANQRQECHRLAHAFRPGHLVCGSPVVLARHQDHPSHPLEGDQARKRQSAGTGHRGVFHGEQGLTFVLHGV